MSDKINTHVAFGKPTLAQSEQQLYYTRHEHRDNAIFTRDVKWFASNPRQKRFIRPALDSEFDCDKEHLDHFGTRVLPPKLWVCVERFLCGEHHRVQPVYRGSCYWDVDKHNYMLPDNRKGEDGRFVDEEGNTRCDTLLWHFHEARGAHPAEMMLHAEKVVEVLQAMSITGNPKDGLVN